MNYLIHEFYWHRLNTNFASFHVWFFSRSFHLVFCFFFLFSNLSTTEHRLTEQEASDEIRSLLQNFVIQLQSVKDRVPSRGSAMTTISILLDTTKPLSNSQISLMPPTLTASTTIKKSGLAVNNAVSIAFDSLCFGHLIIVRTFLVNSSSIYPIRWIDLNFEFRISNNSLHLPINVDWNVCL